MRSALLVVQRVLIPIHLQTRLLRSRALFTTNLTRQVPGPRSPTPTFNHRRLFSSQAMSDSDEQFDLDVSGSDFEDSAPKPKKVFIPLLVVTLVPPTHMFTQGKAPAKAKAATSKAPAKPRARAASGTTKKGSSKVLKDLDANKDDDDDDYDFAIEDDAVSFKAPAEKPQASTKNKSNSEKYQKVGGCLPDGSWLTSLAVDPARTHPPTT